MLDNVRQTWKDNGHGEGLTLFSGDVFSPSPHSSITRGKHMTSVMNALNVDVGVVGNHEFDFGYPRLAELVEMASFPWLLSNVVDTTTNAVPKPMKEFHVVEHAGVRIGFIGLVEKQWLETITGWPKSFEWMEMKEVGLKLSESLRDPAGPHKCDLLIALTHSRYTNDIALARDLFALSPKAQATDDIVTRHGVDLILGGHDHDYWISKGVSSWDGYDLSTELLGAEDDRGDVLVIKSGTDFQDLSDISLVLKDTGNACVRRKIIESIHGTRHVTTWELKDNEPMKNLIHSEVAKINETLPYPICVLIWVVELPLKLIFRSQSALANWVADCLKPVYDGVLRKNNHSPVDGVIICTGDIRAGDFSEGPLTLENLMDMVPFTDPMVVLEMDGEAVWKAIDSGLSKWPETEGRFPAISGFRVTWRSSNKAGHRVEQILLGSEEVHPNHDRMYTVAVGGYMAEGGDGYSILKDQKVVINDENAKMKSALIQQFLSGAHYVNKVSHNPEIKPANLLPETFRF
ncbi:Metallo-dependent phosphatase, partial [Coniophora puteana RWD-64-598 SS2]